MSTNDPFGGNTSPDDHLSIYKEHMYVQGEEDGTCYRYFPITRKELLKSGSMVFLMEVSLHSSCSPNYLVPNSLGVKGKG